VDEHPYYTITAADGSFALADVPAGTYQLVCWLPNWHTGGRDLDPESGIIIRQCFRPPVEVKQTITVEKGKGSSIAVTLQRELFAK